MRATGSTGDTSNVPSSHQRLILRRILICGASVKISGQFSLSCRTLLIKIVGFCDFFSGLNQISRIIFNFFLPNFLSISRFYVCPYLIFRILLELESKTVYYVGFLFDFQNLIGFCVFVF